MSDSAAMSRSILDILRWLVVRESAVPPPARVPAGDNVHNRNDR